MPIRWHEEDLRFLGAAISHTAAKMGLDPRLIEKDYFCSVLLEHLAGSGAGLTFKGGTCLTKVHMGFYRLSEDLDFSISTATGTSRSGRSRSAEVLKAALEDLDSRLPPFRVVEPVRGANKSTQYMALLAYTSLLDAHEERVSIDVGLREPVLAPTLVGEAKTALLDPLSDNPLVATFPVHCLSYAEAMAEKTRAALCRREVAIRDFFDIDYAIRHAAFEPRGEAFLGLLRQKPAVPDTTPVDVSPARLARLSAQLETRLRPMLREREYASFDLGRSIGAVRSIAEALE